MSKNLNIIQAERIIGKDNTMKFSIYLTNSRLKELGKIGAVAIENAVMQEKPISTSSDRIIISPDSQGNNEGGFIGNTINWSQFFPNEQNDQVSELIAKAKKWENNFSLTLKSLMTFIGAGMGTTSTGNMSDLKNMFVTGIFGSFVDLYVIDNPEYTENIQELLNDINS